MLRGVESQGMLLAADDGKHVVHLTCDAVAGENIELAGFTNSDVQIPYDEFAKVSLTVKNGNVFFEKNLLQAKGKPVTVSGIDESKAKIR